MFAREFRTSPALRLVRVSSWQGGFFHISYPNERGLLLLMEAATRDPTEGLPLSVASSHRTASSHCFL